MTEKRFYCDSPLEYRDYGIFDTIKVNKTREDFYDEKEEIYNMTSFVMYLNDHDCMLTGEQVEQVLNELTEENQQLKCALLFYLDLAVSDGSGNWNEQMEKWCNILLNCNYNEAKSKYSEYEYSEKWELG